MISNKAPDADFEALKGQPIGQKGQTRAAYRVLNKPEWVIKESLGSHEANWTEYIVYLSLDGHGLQDVFGRVEAISQTGRFLIIERLDDLTGDQIDLRPKVPGWFSDRKISAWGSVPGLDILKILDYGSLALSRRLSAAPQTSLPTAADIATSRGLLDVIGKHKC